MTILFVLRGWCGAFIAWVRQPSQEAVARAERDRKARARREAQRCIRGR